MRYEAHDSRWMSAVNRAIEQEIRARKFLAPTEMQANDAACYLLESSRRDGSWYVVELYRGVVELHVLCSCPAGKVKMPCKHAAKVLLREGLFQSVRPVKVPTNIRRVA